MPIVIGPGIRLENGVRIGGYAPATGGNITTYTSGNVTYNVHTFTTSGDFVTNSSLPVELLIVAGGGGGGGALLSGGLYYVGGGGGAGGYVSIPTTTAAAATTYPIVIGTGGGAGNAGVNPTSGANSTAFGYTAIGGGSGGDGYTQQDAADGGSGGGVWAREGLTRSPGDGIQFSTLGYGNGTTGGTDQTTASAVSSGNGGGSDKSGDDPTGYGEGLVNNITGTNVTYAQGGESASYQPGTGSGSSAQAGNARPGYGSGGGGGSYGGTTALSYNRQTGTAGTSGVVIIAYPINA